MRAIDADALKYKLSEKRKRCEVWMNDASALLDTQQYNLANDALRRINEFITMVDEMPTIEPERKKGKWIEKEVIHEVEASTAIDEWQSAKCSICGKYHTTPYLYYFDDFNYCPNCGSAMRQIGGDTDES